MALYFSRPVRVQPFFGFRSPERLVLSARAQRSRAPVFVHNSRLRAVRAILSQFAARETSGLTVRLEIRSADRVLLEHTTITDRLGYAHFDLPLDPHWPLPEHPEWEPATLHWTNALGPQRAVAHILVPGRDSDLAVISDIDDTIIETGITGGFGNVVRHWRRLFAELPHERIVVPDADMFYGALGGGHVPEPETGERPAQAILATRRPFFYVSSSPWNLFSYLVAFKRSKGLPLGPLFLRKWGFNKDTFGKASHGAHKLAAIDRILRMYPELRFALIGDDTQGDLPAFAEMVKRHPGRIAAVFLRIVSGQSFSTGENSARATIEGAGVPLWLGENYAVGLSFLRTLGFTPGGETEQIVRAVEKVMDESEPAPS